MRVLVTGVAGTIGRVVAPGLAGRGHTVRGLDIQTPDDAVRTACADGVVQGDCLERDVVREAVTEMDAVVHLASNPKDDTLASSLESHAGTTEVLLQEMLAAGARRIVYASSNHAVGLTPRTELLTTEHRPRPDSNYGIAKVAGEALLSLYADRQGIECVALRIGSFRAEPTTRRELATWLSHGDAVTLVDAALTAPDVDFAVVYGISNNTDAWWDLRPGEALGYVPRDDAAEYADRLPDRAEDEAEARFVGGPMAL